MEQLSEILLVILLQPILKFRQALFGKESLHNAVTNVSQYCHYGSKYEGFTKQ